MGGGSALGSWMALVGRGLGAVETRFDPSKCVLPACTSCLSTISTLWTIIFDIIIIMYFNYLLQNI
jgi:hypothetical protein